MDVLYIFSNWLVCSRDVNFEYHMRVHSRRIFRGLAQLGTFCLSPAMRPLLYAERPLWWERVKCFGVLTGTTPPELAYYTNLEVDELPVTAAVWPIAAIKFFNMALMQFLYAAERGFVGFQCYEPRMGQGASGVFVPLSTSTRRCVYQYSFQHSSLVVLSILSVLSWHIVAQRKSNGRPSTLYTVGFHTDWPAGVYTTRLRQRFGHRRKTPFGHLERTDYMPLGSLSGQGLLLNRQHGKGWTLHVAAYPIVFRGLLIQLLFNRVCLMSTTLIWMLRANGIRWIYCLPGKRISVCV